MKKLPQAAIAQVMKDFAAANAGVYSDETHAYGGMEMKIALPVCDGMELLIRMDKNQTYCSCSTRYKAKGKMFSFDRLGVDDSFYFESVEDLPRQFVEQIDKVKKKFDDLANMKEFNLGPKRIYVTDERLANIVQTLKDGKVFTSTPSGFGTGYRFQTDVRIRNRFDTAKASKELEELVGRKVFVTQFDCD